MSLSGVVHGGQNPVADATIQLYTVGSTGNASAATPMLTTAVYSGAGGGFSITQDYTCGKSSGGDSIPAGSNQVYIVASDGNPGISTNNPKMVMMAALGDCSNLATTKFIEINEITTAAAAWALAPFMTSSTHVGASSTNALGIQNAFLDAALLADTETGLPATLPSNLTIETDKLTAFADAIASCVNSDGTTGCKNLFAAATSSGVPAPTDTLTAALNIVKNPGTNVAAVFNAIGGFPPFATSYTQAPNDWTMSLTVTGGGLVSPTALGIDAQSNVWVANQDGPVSEFNAQGTPLSAAGYGAGSIAQVTGLAIDSSGDIWVTNYNGGSGAGSVTEFSGSTAASPGSILGSYSNSIYYPTAVAADRSGLVYIANQGYPSATLYTNAGDLSAATVGGSYNLNDDPAAIALDLSGGFWLSGDNTVAHIGPPSTAYPNGQELSRPVCCNESYGMASDAFGNLWVADHLGGPQLGGAFAEVVTDDQGNASAPISGATVGGISYPYFVAVDAAQNVWITNHGGPSISEIAGAAGTLTTGSAISPSTGVYATPGNPAGGYGLDSPLVGPCDILPDSSGNLWVSDDSAAHIVMFFGLATPTAVPLGANPVAP
jgi:hypothetical protein